MSIDQKTLEEITLKDLGLREDQFQGVTVENYVDFSGDDALRVTLVVPDEMELTGREVSEIKRGIYDRLMARGINLFPYIFLISPSDLTATDPEEDI